MVVLLANSVKEESSFSVGLEGTVGEVVLATAAAVIVIARARHRLAAVLRCCCCWFATLPIENILAVDLAKTVSAAGERETWER